MYDLYISYSHQSIAYEQKKKIRWSMSIIERRSCIQFKETSFKERPTQFLAIVTGNS